MMNLRFFSNTLPKTNIAPQKWWLGSYFPFQKSYFQVRTVSFREGLSLIFGGAKKSLATKPTKSGSVFDRLRALSRWALPSETMSFSQDLWRTSISTCFQTKYGNLGKLTQSGAFYQKLGFNRLLIITIIFP